MQTVMIDPNRLIKSVLVVGSAGFLGSQLAKKLLAENWFVRGLDIVPTNIDCVESFVGDLTKFDQILAACEGIDTVFHTASALYKAPRDLIWRVNVEGTRTLISACQKSGVSRLIYTSSCSVIFHGDPIVGGDEKMPYISETSPACDTYALSKVEAEKLVLAANNQCNLLTVIIRPHQIYGIGDKLFVPQIVSNVHKLVVALGDGKNLFSTTHLYNCIHGEILAAKKLASNPSVVQGQIYHINDGEEANFWEETFEIASSITGYSKSKMGLFWIPRSLALFVAGIVEVIGRHRGKEVTFNKYAVYLATTTRTYSISKAQKDLGYKPVISMKKGFEETIWHAKKEYQGFQSDSLPILSYWLFFVALASLFGTIQALYTTELLKRNQFDFKSEQVTPLTGRLFACWTLLATLIRVSCALDPFNRPIYTLGISTFVVAITFYLFEFVLQRSMSLGNFLLPISFALPSLIWMAFFPPTKKISKRVN